MRRAPADFREIVQAVEIRSAGSFRIAGERFDAPVELTDADGLAGRLAHALYQRKYCRPTQGTSLFAAPDGRASRVFVERLSQANCGKGAWQSGWLLERIEEDGRLVVRRQQDNLMVWAQRDQYRPTDDSVRVAGAGRVCVGKEMREMFPGYYMFFGDADQSGVDGAPQQIVRLYWHLTADAALAWVRELTARFNAANIAFHAKVLNDPTAYRRADGGVLYLERRDLAQALPLIPGLHAALSAGLRPPTPMFTKRLARGLAVAEDPGDGRSFGQHRCQLISEGLVRAFTAGAVGSEQALIAVLDRFAEEGLTCMQPWLNAGSRHAYTWPSRHQT